MTARIDKPRLLKAAAAGALTITGALGIGLIDVRHGDLDFARNGALATIGLGAVIHGLLTLVIAAIRANIRQDRTARARKTLTDAIEKGQDLAEADAREKVAQKTRRTMTPPDKVH